MTNESAGQICEQCKKRPAEDEHTCPYDEMLGDGDTMCNCCPDCEAFCGICV